MEYNQKDFKDGIIKKVSTEIGAVINLTQNQITLPPGKYEIICDHGKGTLKITQVHV